MYKVLGTISYLMVWGHWQPWQSQEERMVALTRSYWVGSMLNEGMNGLLPQLQHFHCLYEKISDDSARIILKLAVSM